MANDLCDCFSIFFLLFSYYKDYRLGMLDILPDNKTDSKTNEMPLNRLREFFIRFVKSNKDCLTPNEANYLYKFDVKLIFTAKNTQMQKLHNRNNVLKFSLKI